MTENDVQRWLDEYREAWLSYDGAAIAALFSEDASYRYHPWDEPVIGREAIVQSWLTPDGSASGRDEPGTYDGEYRPWMVAGDVGVAVGRSFYWSDASRVTLEQTYHNCWLLRFDADGRCREFTELFMLEPPFKGES
ncbi:MAG TPA: nuclear transport factor 2 family protein [Candidatus Dormibacteraeota bacterium]|nr:nuclear transport factor 2 family protein [Candidatus Dormibacteraeota bacterium]